MICDDEDIRLRLSRLLKTAKLRATVAEAGAGLLARLDAPVRVVLFGLPDVGKSRLINRIVGRRLLPQTPQLPTTIITAGNDLKSHATLPDGSRRDWSGVPFDAIVAEAPLLIEIETHAPVLRQISLMRIAADASAEDQLAAMRWATPRCDIALWCSHVFTAREADIWDSAPDALKDNAYLVLNGTAPEVPAVAFLDCISLSDVPPDSAGPLAEALLVHAVRGRQALTDHALLFLNRYQHMRFPAAASEAGPAPQAKAMTAPEGPPPPVSDTAAADAWSRNDVSGICVDSVSLLRGRARDLTSTLADGSQDPAPLVFGHCAETMDDLVSRILAVGTPDLEELVLDTADTITLLQGEGGLAQAADTVTLLLQLRRDLEARIAA